jgi:hypothetical protein
VPDIPEADMRSVSAFVPACVAVFSLLIPCISSAATREDGETESFNFEVLAPDADSGVARMPNAPFGPMAVRVRPNEVRYHVGDSARIRYSANRDCQVFIFITDSEGSSRLIFPNFFDRDNRVKANRRYSIPDRRYELQVTGPTGPVDLTIVGVEKSWPFLDEWIRYSQEDPYPAFRGGATELTRRIESQSRQPSVFERRAIRPVPREQLYAVDTTSFYVMDSSAEGIWSSRFGTVDIYSQPDQARIFVDGVYHGRTPEALDRLRVGYRTIRLEKEGYLPWERRVYVRPRETRQLDVFLEPTPLEPGYSRSDKPKNQGFFFLPRKRLE